MIAVGGMSWLVDMPGGRIGAHGRGSILSPRLDLAWWLLLLEKVWQRTTFDGVDLHVARLWL